MIDCNIDVRWARSKNAHIEIDGPKFVKTKNVLKIGDAPDFSSD